MTRAGEILGTAAWRALLAACLIWWAPSLGLMLAGLWADRARFALAIGLGRALVAVGAVGAARAVFAHEAARCRRRGSRGGGGGGDALALAPRRA